MRRKRGTVTKVKVWWLLYLDGTGLERFMKNYGGDAILTEAREEAHGILISSKMHVSLSGGTRSDLDGLEGYLTEVTTGLDSSCVALIARLNGRMCKLYTNIPVEGKTVADIHKGYTGSRRK